MKWQIKCILKLLCKATVLQCWLSRRVNVWHIVLYSICVCWCLSHMILLLPSSWPLIVVHVLTLVVTIAVDHLNATTLDSLFPPIYSLLTFDGYHWHWHTKVALKLLRGQRQANSLNTHAHMYIDTHMDTEVHKHKASKKKKKKLRNTTATTQIRFNYNKYYKNNNVKWSLLCLLCILVLLCGMCRARANVMTAHALQSTRTHTPAHIYIHICGCKWSCTCL